MKKLEIKKTVFFLQFFLQTWSGEYSNMIHKKCQTSIPINKEVRKKVTDGALFLSPPPFIFRRWEGPYYTTSTLSIVG